MKILFLCLLTFSLLLSCTTTKKKSGERNISSTASDNVDESPFTEDELISDIEDDDDLLAFDGAEEAMPSDNEMPEIGPMEKEGPVITYDESEVYKHHKVNFTNVKGNYTTIKGETLMFISYKLFGDYRYWKDIVKHNPGKFEKNYFVKEGTEISYFLPVHSFSMNNNGNPYLIKSGDTLGKISTKLYENTTLWKKIWKNNSSMIRHPDLIFAGFTLFYEPKDQMDEDMTVVKRDISSKKSI